MAYAARIERDSVSPDGMRLTSVVVTYPREVLAEVGTHRTLSEGTELTMWERTLDPGLSKNSASSRAIPIFRMLESVQADPYIPIHFGAAQKGMQADNEVSPATREEAVSAWLEARDHMVRLAAKLAALGIHKQVANRLIEPFAWITQIITGTADAWANFFALRTHRDAHPAFRHVARMVYLCYRESEPVPVAYGQWHLPFVAPDVAASLLNYNPVAELDRGAWPWPPPPVLVSSAARTARVSYLKHDSTSAGPSEDWELVMRLAGSFPVHASPFEAQATPMPPGALDARPWLRSNLTGWLQLRKLVRSERATEFAPTDAEVASWGLSGPLRVK